MENNMHIIGVIPARMASTRYPGKPLEPILGMPMIGHVYKRSKMSTLLSEVYIATYTFDKEIIAYGESIGAKVIAIDTEYPGASGITGHVMLEVEKQTGKMVDIVVMIQGDEPMITPEMIDMAVQPMLTDASLEVVNLMAPIDTDEEHNDPNCPKVVVDKNNNALYFSREPIPSQKKWKGGVFPRWKQVCIIPFRREAIIRFNELEPTVLERVESIDMNRLLENDHRVHMVPENIVTQCVDTPADLLKVEHLMQGDALFEKYRS